jgi:P-type Cu+ transporter
MHFQIKGMTCASCMTRIEHALRATPGVVSAHANLGTEEAVVQYVPGTTDVEAVRKAVASAGYEIANTPPPRGTTAVDRDCQERDREYRTLMRQWWFGAAVGTFTMIMSYPWLFPGLGRLLPRESHRLWYMWAGMGVASLAVMLYSGRHFFTGAWQALKDRSANMHTLIALGTEASPEGAEYRGESGRLAGRPVDEMAPVVSPTADHSAARPSRDPGLDRRGGNHRVQALLDGPSNP